LQVRFGRVAALAGIDLEIPAGTCVALVGGSGAGKSTLVDAVLGLVAPTSGWVRINGIALDELPLASLRRRIGYMGQDTVLYNGSIRENILWGTPSADDGMLDEAVRLAGADAFIAKLQFGYETPVGDGGRLLSGGERQRLGLARAALGRPGLLILDEATSALDAETERTVTAAVAALKGKTTTILIAHRLSSARIADTIVVMEGGVIVEHGTWDALMERRGRLYHLWELQHAAPASVT
jgi:ATP-binding cassette subfamily B protein